MTKHWHIENDISGLCWLSIDKTDSTTNVLSGSVLKELSELVDHLELDPPIGVVIRSNKTTGFVLGADITEFGDLNGIEEAEALVLNVHRLFDRIENLPCPTIALIEGFALGGGLELALACDYRLVVMTDSRTIGFPEIQLGIHPGFGGTVRSVRILGALAAMDLMLSGKMLTPQQALNIGLISSVADRSQIETKARHLVSHKPSRRKAPLYLKFHRLKPCRI